MHDHEEHEQPGGDEVDRARRLPAAEEVEQPGPGGVHARRHGEAGQDHDRDQDQQHREVGELLQHVVAPRGLPLGEVQRGVVLDVAPEAPGAKLGRIPRQQVAAQVAVNHAQEAVGEDAGGEDPGEGQVPAPRLRQVVPRGDRRPAREGIEPLGPEHAARAKGLPADAQVAVPVRVADLEPGRIEVGAVLAPVEPRVGVEDHQPAHQEDDERHHGHPMPDPGGKAVPPHQLAAERARGCICLLGLRHALLLSRPAARARKPSPQRLYAQHLQFGAGGPRVSRS